LLFVCYVTISNFKCILYSSYDLRCINIVRLMLSVNGSKMSTQPDKDICFSNVKSLRQFKRKDAAKRSSVAI